MTTSHVLPAGTLPYDDSPRLDPATVARTESLVKRYWWTSTLFLLIAGLLGLVLRSYQAGLDDLPGNQTDAANLWYALMTAHGLGAFVAWAAFFLMGTLLWLLMRLGFPLRTYVFAEISYWAMVIGTLGIVVSTVFLGFAASWVALYPLPFHSAGQWTDTATFIFSFSVLLAGVSIIAWCVALIISVTGPAISGEQKTGWFGRLGLALGFGLMWPSRFKSDRETPYPIIPITVIGINMFFMTLPFALLLVLMIVQTIDSGFTTDPELAKNLLWAFGHPVVYLLLFPVVAALYYFIPRYAKRPLVFGKVVVLAWTIGMLANMFLWAHHMYMDYPDGSNQSFLNMTHEPITYLITLPSALSLFGLGATIYRSNFEWSPGSMFMVAGIIGWLSAGFQGVINATIQFNVAVHNTLWIVGHFHHMALLAMGMVIFGVFYAAAPTLLRRELHSQTMAKIHFWGMLIGGYGWVVCWLGQGLDGAPRRYDRLPDGFGWDIWTKLSIPFMLILAVAILVGIYNIWRTATGSPWRVKDPATAV
ncbi:MAG: cbb3-type cytochrome c oxidase subunit I [Thermoleophilia bacterium]|nr:cbb3-type cytochrome c oxidase subunit I [Thermoleophilia bacterium]